MRRAFLCGTDPATGRSFEHRKQWIEERILELGNLFAVAIHAYAVMSNHVHVVLDVDPHAPLSWTDEEVARRWLSLCCVRADLDVPMAVRIRHLTGQPERLAVLRVRLGSLSWFMRFLKEPIARQSNREDGCTGRFWEGRFKTQALLDDPAVLACMVYVDLNPVRAGFAETAENSPHTSLRRRVANQDHPHSVLQPLAASVVSQLPSLTLRGYQDLVRWTGGELHGNQANSTGMAIPWALRRVGLRPDQWLLQVPATESHFWRAIGTAQALLELATTTGQRWIKGIGNARAIATMPTST